ncbi:LIM-domain binding protein-domain-containing protein, partial [Lentinula raphanica]
PPALEPGTALARLLQFSDILASGSESDSNERQTLAWWTDLVREYFHPGGVVRFTLGKDDHARRGEGTRRAFDIPIPILPRLLLVTTQSGVQSMTLTLDGARERPYGHDSGDDYDYDYGDDYGHAIVVESVAAAWTCRYRYPDGYTVVLSGPLRVRVRVS